jgi:hypothetical protein
MIGQDDRDDHAATFLFCLELPVTAYIVSLALAGILAIAIWECFE